MKYCNHCGAMLDDEVKFCPTCGGEVGTPETAPQNNNMNQQYQQPYNQYQQPVNDSGSIGWGFLGFCIPLVGLILFLVWKDEKPKSAKSAGIGALVSVIMVVVFYVILIVIGVSVAALASTAAMTLV